MNGLGRVWKQPKPKKVAISKFDLLVYKLFYYRWNKILKTRIDLLDLFIKYLTNYREKMNNEYKMIPDTNEIRNRN